MNTEQGLYNIEVKAYFFIPCSTFDIPPLSVSVQIRALFEKAQNILRLYAQYTYPKSKEGSKLSPEEKERLLDLFLHELRIVIDQFGGRVLIRVGGFIRKVFNKLFG